MADSASETPAVDVPDKGLGSGQAGGRTEAPSGRGRDLTVAALALAAVLLVVGTLAALYQWHLSLWQVIAVVCLVAGMLLLSGATFFWLVTYRDKTAVVVAEGQTVLGTGAGLILVLWGQAFIALGFIASWRLLYPPKQALPLAPGTTELPAVGDVVKLIQALTVAPTWLGMTVVGIALTGAGAWAIRRSRSDLPSPP